MFCMRKYSLEEDGIIKSITINSIMRLRDRRDRRDRPSRSRSRYHDHDLEPIDFYPRCAIPVRIDTPIQSRPGCRCRCTLCLFLTVFLILCSMYFVMTKYKLIVIHSIDNHRDLDNHLDENDLHKQATDIISVVELDRRISDLKKEVEAMRSELSKRVETLAIDMAKSAVDVQNRTQNRTESCEDPVDAKIQHALTVYDADKIGLFDYAAAYAGGAIVSTPETLPYPLNQTMEVFGVFKVRVWSKPEYILQPDSLPGECFVFYGTEGKIIIQLGSEITISAVTLEHVPPMLVKDQSCAPRDFIVLGMQDEYYEGEPLGRFTYEIKGPPFQTFKTTNNPKKYSMVMLHILNNYGNQEFTCVYRFRVHSP